ncbi:YdcF family protein [Snodgrassella alvi]|uniref:YdcF family protein n=1 Tax=Snodgrassella TaxID=1193515 RepID=UPI00345FB0A7
MSNGTRFGFWYCLRSVITAGSLFVAANYAISMATVYQFSHPQLLSEADAAIVLGAAAWDKRPSPVFRERINHAINLYRAGKVKKILFTGGSPRSGFMTEAAVGRRYAIRNGVDASDIIYENHSRDTWQNLVNAQALAEDNDIDTFIIVSDPYHLARACIMARDLGLDVQVSPTPTTRYTATQSKLRFLAQESYTLMVYQWVKHLAHFPQLIQSFRSKFSSFS